MPRQPHADKKREHVRDEDIGDLLPELRRILLTPENDIPSPTKHPLTVSDVGHQRPHQQRNGYKDDYQA